MSTQIVVVNVSVQPAPLPVTLQQSGAFISQGGTTLSAGTYASLPTSATLATILTAPLSLTGIVQSGGTATATAASAHGITSGDTFLTTVSGASPVAYDGTILATSTGTSTFTYAVPSGTASPATGTITYTERNVAELVAMNTTWWSQTNAGNLAPYVLELGASEDTVAIAALSTYIAANPNSSYVPGAQGFFYSYLVPRSWAGVAGYLTFLAQFNNPTSLTKFFTTMTTGNYTSFTSLNTCVVGLVEAPGIPATEFSLASGFYVTLNYNPTTTNKVPPLNNAFVSGVTAYPLPSNTTLLNAFKTAGVNWISTGAQGGITFTTFVYGTTKDALSFNFGYSVDWVQINCKVTGANIIINGANNPTDPIYYNQDGVNRLQSGQAANVLQPGVNSGLIFGTVTQTDLDATTFNTNFNNGLYVGQCVINAVPVQTWLTANPSTYAQGVYGGFTIVMTPQLGFTQIIFNLSATSFA